MPQGRRKAAARLRKCPHGGLLPPKFGVGAVQYRRRAVLRFRLPACVSERCRCAGAWGREKFSAVPFFASPSEPGYPCLSQFAPLSRLPLPGLCSRSPIDPRQCPAVAVRGSRAGTIGASLRLVGRRTATSVSRFVVTVLMRELNRLRPVSAGLDVDTPLTGRAPAAWWSSRRSSSGSAPAPKRPA